MAKRDVFCPQSLDDLERFAKDGRSPVCFRYVHHAGGSGSVGRGLLLALRVVLADLQLLLRTGAGVCGRHDFLHGRGGGQCFLSHSCALCSLMQCLWVERLSGMSRKFLDVQLRH